MFLGVLIVCLPQRRWWLPRVRISHFMVTAIALAPGVESGLLNERSSVSHVIFLAFRKPKEEP